MERNSKRRQIKPSENLLDIEDLGESSDDSDFRIEDHCLESDSSDDSEASNSSGDDSDSDANESDSKEDKKPLVNNVQQNTTNKLNIDNTEVDENIVKKILICCVCLGDRSDDVNEIIECDGCGITVHEGCYGVQDTASLSSTVSSCSTEPWFCEACRAGVTNPTCELCPNFGGIFKETDVGKWVHLVCALYIPGIAFGEVDRLSSVTLFEFPASRWGNKTCQLCQDHRFARTGVTIECDAGMCRAYFHVTCGQREGLLSEATSEEVEQADPFYAHCRLHSDKNQIKKRKRNWLALQLRTQKMGHQKVKESCDETPVWKRNQRKLSKYRVKYCEMKATRIAPWVPLQKRPRLLTTSASACRALWRKSELMGIDMASFEETEALITTLQDIPRKWNIPPAFSVEFIGYFLDRDSRVNRLKKQLSHHAENKSRLINEQQELQKKYDSLTAENKKLTELNDSLKSTIQKYYNTILKVRPNVKLKDIQEFDKVDSLSSKVQYASDPARGSVPTAAALKAGVGFPLRLPAKSHKEEKNALELNNKCGLCFQSKDQHLLTKCDTCEKHYHLGCLNPPLTRMPKKTKLMGWQCSECDKDSCSSDNERVDTEAPRKLRRGSKERGDSKNESESSARNSFDAGEPIEIRKIKKHKREKHRIYYPDGIENIQIPVEKHHSRKRKHRSPDNGSEPELEQPRQGIKLFIKSIPNSSGQANFIATQSPTSSTFVAKTEEYVKAPQPVKNVPEAAPAPKTRVNKSIELQERCDTCENIGTNANMVRCDECSKSFHFSCLDPPVKKSPKVRGYSWHCANCDPTETDSD